VVDDQRISSVVDRGAADLGARACHDLALHRSGAARIDDGRVASLDGARAVHRQFRGELRECSRRHHGPGPDAGPLHPSVPGARVGRRRGPRRRNSIAARSASTRGRSRRKRSAPRRAPQRDGSRTRPKRYNRQINRYTRVAVALHWLIAALLLGQIAFGWFLTTIARGSAMRGVYVNFHKSTGITIAALILV